jgi:hypothetical protein
MKAMCILICVLFLVTPLTGIGQPQTAPATRSGAGLERMPHDLEVQFAVSALSEHLRERATIYVLDPNRGYAIDRKGTNGMSCLVERTEWARVDFRDDIYTAICIAMVSGISTCVALITRGRHSR